jgi:hypothetical protein
MSNRLFFGQLLIIWAIALGYVAYGQMKPASAPCPFPRDAGAAE